MNYENNDKSFTIFFTIALAVIHGGFWLGVGLAVGKLLWGIP